MWCSVATLTNIIHGPDPPPSGTVVMPNSPIGPSRTARSRMGRPRWSVPTVTSSLRGGWTGLSVDPAVSDSHAVMAATVSRGTTELRGGTSSRSAWPAASSRSNAVGPNPRRSRLTPGRSGRTSTSVRVSGAVTGATLNRSSSSAMAGGRW